MIIVRFIILVLSGLSVYHSHPTRKRSLKLTNTNTAPKEAIYPHLYFKKVDGLHNDDLPSDLKWLKPVSPLAFKRRSH